MSEPRRCSLRLAAPRAALAGSELVSVAVPVPTLSSLTLKLIARVRALR